MLFRSVKAVVTATNQTGETQHTFPDVLGDSYCYKAVQTAYANKIVFGAADGNFYPDAAITAAEANMILARAGIKGTLEGEIVSRKAAAKIIYQFIIS